MLSNSEIEALIEEVKPLSSEVESNSDIYKNQIEKEFRKKVCGEIEIFCEGKDRFVVAVPFTFEDGDF